MKHDMEFFFWAFHLLGWELGLRASTQMRAQSWRSNAGPQQVSRTLRSLGWSSTSYRIKACKQEIFHEVARIDSNGYFQKTAYWNHLHMFRFENQPRSLHIVKYNGCLYQLQLSVYLHATEYHQPLTQPAAQGWEDNNTVSKPSQTMSAQMIHCKPKQIEHEVLNQQGGRAWRTHKIKELLGYF